MKFQPVQFRDIEELFAWLPDKEKDITLAIRDIILNVIPHAKEKLAYNVPFYYGKSRICFIWPGSVPWGTTKEGVAIGLCKGYLIEDPFELMEKGNRKEVTMKTFYSVRDIPVKELRFLLSEAARIDKS